MSTLAADDVSQYLEGLVSDEGGLWSQLVVSDETAKTYRELYRASRHLLL